MARSRSGFCKSWFCLALAVWLGFGLISTSHVRAQEASGRRQDVTDAAPQSRLPDDVATRHTLELPGRTLRFTATAGSIAIRDAAGAMLADVGYTSYVLDGQDVRTRPLAFAFNGGPGSSSAWLHLGAMGPWRVPLTAETINATGVPQITGNAETWLDFADLVFIDPPGTGQSRIWPKAGETGRDAAGANGRRDGGPSGRQSGGRQWFWSLRGDIETFVEVIKNYTRQASRGDSPIVLVGESYGGFRAPLIAEGVVRDHALGLRALVLVSPVIDFDGRRGGHLPMHYVNLLPSLAATRQERLGVEPTRQMLAGVEAYSRGEYLTDLVRGLRDEAAIGRLVSAVSEFTGLAGEHVRSALGRVSARHFVRSSPLFGREAVSLYDAGMTGLGSGEARQTRGAGDAFTNGLTVPLRRAMEALHVRLGWKSERHYELLSSEVTQGWIWRNSPYSPQALDALHSVLATDQRRRALVTHGFTDLVTPYMASAIQLDMLPAMPALRAGGGAGEHRIQFEVYPGGHMFYSRDGSRARFRADGARTIESAVQPLQSTTSGQRETP